MAGALHSLVRLLEPLCGMSTYFTPFCWAGPDQGIPSFSYLVGGDQGETEVGLLASIVPKQSVH